MILRQRSSARDSVLSLRLVVLKRDLLQDCLKYRQQFHGCFLKQRKVEVGD